MDGLTDQKSLDARLESHLDTNVEDLKLVKLEDAEDGQLSLPGGEGFLSADFVRDGYDLILDGGADVGLVFIPEYFSSDTPPALNLGDAGVISADLATKLAGPMTPAQIAQIGIGAPQSVTVDSIGESIGSVNELTGTVNVTRVDGTQVTLSQGDPIYQGDVIETSDASNVGIVFADDTLFSLEAGGRMVMDEMVYDPDTQSGVFETTVVKGVFSFVSGQSAKTDPDAMVIHTPKTTIGIRGTSGLGKTGVEDETAEADGAMAYAAGTNIGGGTQLAQAPGPVDSFVLVPDPGSKFVGEVVIGGKTVNTAFGSVNIGNGFVSDPVSLSPAEVLSTFGGAMVNLANVATNHAQAKAQQAETKAREAQDQASQQQEEAQQAEEQAADAEADAAQAESDAEAKAAEAEAAKAEAEALKAAAEAEQDAAAKAEAEAAAAEAEARAAEAEAEAQAEAEAAAQKTQEAEALQVEAQAKVEQALQAEQQAQQAVQQQTEAQTLQAAVQQDAQLQQQMFTQFEQTGAIDPELEQQFMEPVAGANDPGAGEPQPDEPQGDEQQGDVQGENQGPDEGGLAAEEAFQQAVEQGATADEAFEAAARAAMEADGGEFDPNDPGVQAAQAAYEEALANGATPEEAMLAAQQAVDQFNVDQQGEQFVDPNAQQVADGEAVQNPDGQAQPQGGGQVVNTSGDVGDQGSELPEIDPNLTPDENFDAIANAASGGDMDSPEVQAARTAFDEALVGGATQEEAMQAAMQAAEQTGQAGGSISDFGDFGTTSGMIIITADGQALTSTGSTDMIHIGTDGSASVGDLANTVVLDDTVETVQQDEGAPPPPTKPVPLPSSTQTTTKSIDVNFEETQFPETIFISLSELSYKGTLESTNFYFDWQTLKGTAPATPYAMSITDEGADRNQISFGGMVDVRFEVTAETDTKGSVVLYDAVSGGNHYATLSYTGIHQVLLTNLTNTSLATDSFTTTVETGTIFALKGLEAGNTGTVYGWTNSADTVTISSGDQIHLGNGGNDIFTFSATSGGGHVAGGAGDDTFNMNQFIHGWEIYGGVGSDTVDYSGYGSSIYGDFKSDAVYLRDHSDHGSATVFQDLYIDEHDTFKGSSAADYLYFTGSSYGTVEGGGGNDVLDISGEAKLATVKGDAGDDTIRIDADSLKNKTLSDTSIGGVTTSIDGGTTSETNGDTLEIRFDNAQTVAASDFGVTSNFELFKGSVNSDVTGTISLDLAAQAGTVLEFNSSNASTDDTLTISGAQIHTTHTNTLNAGSSGTDTLVLSGGGTISSAQMAKAVGWETIQLTDAAYTLTLANFTQNTTIDGTAIVTAANGISVDGTAVTTSGVDLTITGGAGNDTLTGGSGADTINGGSGTDSIFGGLGADTLTGSGGTDVFKYTATTQSGVGTGDTITDFDANGETINLLGLQQGTFSFLGNETVSFNGSVNSEGRFNNTTKLLELDMNADGTVDMNITLTGVDISDLSAADFTFV